MRSMALSIGLAFLFALRSALDSDGTTTREFVATTIVLSWLFFPVALVAFVMFWPAKPNRDE